MTDNIFTLKTPYGLFRRAYELPDLNFNETDSGILTVDEVEIYD